MNDIWSGKGPTGTAMIPPFLQIFLQPQYSLPCTAPNPSLSLVHPKLTLVVILHASFECLLQFWHLVPGSSQNACGNLHSACSVTVTLCPHQVEPQTLTRLANWFIYNIHCLVPNLCLLTILILSQKTSVCPQVAGYSYWQQSHSDTGVPPESGKMWVFGYRSFIWKVDSLPQDKLVVYITNYSPCFRQDVTDEHRVLTSLEELWLLLKILGVLLTIGNEEDVKNYLEFREKGGSRATTVIVLSKRCCNETYSAFVCYCSSSYGNPNSLGSAPLEDIAEHNLSAAGPRGRNTECLFELAGSVRTLVPGDTDKYLFSSGKLVKEC